MRLDQLIDDVVCTLNLEPQNTTDSEDDQLALDWG
jgi:hypothetical protein